LDTALRCSHQRCRARRLALNAPSQGLIPTPTAASPEDVSPDRCHTEFRLCTWRRGCPTRVRSTRQPPRGPRDVDQSDRPIPRVAVSSGDRESASPDVRGLWPVM
jgi:hypothetical protein